jgi:predicted O-methyltransferase YrrM
VARAEGLAAELGFTRSCLPEVGQLVHVLAAQRGRLRVAEIGAGAGVGAAWIVSALPPHVQFFTVELDGEHAAAARELFRDDPNVHVLHGDWREVLAPEAPFDLVFVDATPAKLDGLAVLELVAPGGTVVLDDFWERPTPDPVRDFWHEHPDVAAAEVFVTPEMTAIVAVRVR